MDHKRDKTLKDVRNIVTASLRKGGWDGEHHYHDAIQEGVIRAWLDWDNPKYDDAYLVNRACQWARAYAEDKGRGHHQPTGHIRVSAMGVTTANGNAGREKIWAYQAEYFALHGEKPNSVQTGKAVGMRPATVRELLKHADSHHAPRGRLSAITPQPFSLNWLLDDSGDLEQTESWTAGPDNTQEVVMTDNIRHLLSLTTPKRARWIFLARVCGWTGKEIAEKDNVKTYSVIDREIRKGLQDIREGVAA